MNVSEILEFKQWVVGERNSKRVNEQAEDQKFFTDEYDLPLIKDTKYQIKTGYVADMANTITNQLIGTNPRCYVEPKNHGENTKKASDRVARTGNEWLSYWLRAYSNPYRETFKDKFVRGESYIYLVHNEALAKWMKGKWQEETPKTCPVIPIFYDPMVVFIDPSEELNGQPSRVVVSYKRTAGDLHTRYPYWDTGDLKPSKLIDFFLYYDKDNVFAFAGDLKEGAPLFSDSDGNLSNGTGIKRNIYGEVPFLHRYSGWGKSDAGKSPELMAFSRIRQLRNLIVEDSTMASDFSKNIHTTAAPHRTLFIPETSNINEVEAFKGYNPAPDTISIVRLPSGVPKEYFDVEKTLTYGPEVFAYASQVRGRLNTKYPESVQGIASGTSGRQEDILNSAGLSIYDCAVDNTNTLWADVIALGIRICSNKELDILPPDLQENDYKSYAEITVNLRKDDPIDMARKTATVERQWQMGLITHEKALMEMGYTKEEANRMRAEAWVEMVMRSNPAIVQMIVQVMAQEMNQEEQMSQIQGIVSNAVSGLNPSPDYGAKGGEPRTGNIKTEAGMEQADMGEIRPARQSPQGAVYG